MNLFSKKKSKLQHSKTGNITKDHKKSKNPRKSMFVKGKVKSL